MVQFEIAGPPDERENTTGIATLHARLRKFISKPEAMQFFIAQFDRFRKGESLLNVVDKKLGY